jgi:FkbM family methyltransferase
MKKTLVKFFLGKIFPNNRFHIRAKKVFGLNLYVFADQHVGRKILLNAYEQNEVDFFLGEVRDSDVCLDVGANIGYFSFLFATKAQKVYSIEPIRINVKLMELSASINNIENMVIINSLASDENGFEEFIEAEETSLSGIRKNGFEQDLETNYGVTKTISYQVSSITIDKIDFPRLDIVKIDVEGAELKVLKGMKKTLEKYTPRLLMIEAVPSALKLHGDSFDGLIEFMRGMKYQPMILKSRELKKYQDDGGGVPNDNLFFKYVG